MNPSRGAALLIAVDLESGQLFFCSSKGDLLARDCAAKARLRELGRYDWASYGQEPPDAA